MFPGLLAGEYEVYRHEVPWMIAATHEENIRKLESRSKRSTSDTLWRMANIGCFSYSGVGHVSPLLALARRLQRRGHNITFFQLADLKSRIEAAGIRHVSIGEDELPAGSLARELEDLSKLEGAAAFERVIASVTRESLLVLRDAPELLRKHEIDFILVDECCDAAATVARTLTEISRASDAQARLEELERLLNIRRVAS
jgi:hypothetical protein